MTRPVDCQAHAASHRSTRTKHKLWVVPSGLPTSYCASSPAICKRINDKPATHFAAEMTRLAEADFMLHSSDARTVQPLRRAQEGIMVI